jgi:hypothetical protein
MSKRTTTYDTIFRGKFLFMDCKSFDELINRCYAQAKQFEAMKADKLRLDVSGGEDDYFFIRTKDEKLAKKHGLCLSQE